MPRDMVMTTVISIRDVPTKAKLNKLAKADNDSYDSIICRLLQERDDARRIPINDHGNAFLGRGNKGKKAIVIGMED